MPSDRFFYRPVAPNYEAIGAGIAGGVTRGVGNFYDEQDRARQRGREDAADARVDREDAYLLATRGGGTGAPPLQEGAPQLDFGGIGMDAGPGSILTRDIKLRPDEGPVAELSRPDAPTLRQYQTHGEGDDMVHWEDPEGRNERLQRSAMDLASEGRMREVEMEIGLENAEVDRRRQRYLDAVLQGNPEADMNEASSDFGKMEYGDATYRDLHPQAGSRTGGASWKNFYDAVVEGTLQTDENGNETTRIPENEIIDLTNRLFAGDPTARIPSAEEAENAARNEMLSGLFGQPQGIGDLLGPGLGVADEAAPEVATISDEDAKTIQLSLKNFPPEDWEKLLAEDGFSPADIKKILG